MRRVTLLKAGLAAAVVVAVGTAGVWYLFVDTPSVTDGDLNATTPPLETSSPPQRYTVSANVTVRSLSNDSERSAWSVGSAYDAETGQHRRWLYSSTPRQNFSETTYQHYENDTTITYTRYRTTDEAAFRRRVASVRDDRNTGNETLRIENDSRTYYHREGESGRRLDTGIGNVPLGPIYAIPYERTGTTTFEGATVETYAPIDGWVDTSDADTDPDTYVYATDGRVYVDPETGWILRADLRLSTKRTEMRAGRWFGQEGERTRLEYRFDTALEETPLRPAWVTEEANRHTVSAR